MIRTVIVSAIILTLAGVNIARADLVSDARQLQITLSQNERHINKIANLESPPPKGVPAKLAEQFRKTRHLAEKCLASIKTAKVYAKKVELGDKSNETIQVLQQHLYKLRLAQDELEDSVKTFNGSYNTWRGSH